jgi:hypothetical protein
MLQEVLMKTLIDEASLGQKIQSSGDVSEKGRYALDATEKNPNIEGTIAEDLANVTNIMTRIKNTMDTMVSLPDGSVAEDGEIAAAKIGPNGERYTTLQDAITQQISDYKGVAVSNTEPAAERHVDVWVNTNENVGETVCIPEVDDNAVSEVDTWSSAKINAMINALQTMVSDGEGGVIRLANLIDDSDTAFDKVWSSNRTRTEILAALTNITDGEGNTFNIFDLIDDSTEAYNKLWSSIKIRAELNSVKEMIQDSEDMGIKKYIDDAIEATDKIWSSSKIRAELNAVLSKIPSGGGGGTINIFDYIDDTTTGTGKLWSSSKINTELNNLKTTVKSEVKTEVVTEVKQDIDLSSYAKKLKYQDKVVEESAWVEDTEYTGFGFVAQIVCDGVTADYVAEVIFSINEVIAGIFAPISETCDGYIKIWASEKPTGSITIPTILCFN